MPEGQVVFITGASSGIGYATALEFAHRGYMVAGTARRADRLETLRQQIAAMEEGEGRFLPVACDVRDREAMRAAVASVVDRWGRLDVLVANAGVGHRGSLVDSDWDDLETLMRTNMDGVLHSIRASVPAMRHSGGGHIIIISSIVYNMTSPYAALYAASKAFVSSIAHSLRLELKSDNIKVTDILVGRTRSEFNEKRLGKAGRSGGGIPIMPPETVASSIADLVGKNRRTVTLRWLDRLIVLGNAIAPDVIGRLAMRQYK